MAWSWLVRGTIVAGALLGGAAQAHASVCFPTNHDGDLESPLIADVDVPLDALPWFVADTCETPPACGLFAYVNNMKPVPATVECVGRLARIVPEVPLEPDTFYFSDCDAHFATGRVALPPDLDLIRFRTRSDSAPSLPPLTIVQASASIDRVFRNDCGDHILEFSVEFAEDDATVAEFFAESGVLLVENAADSREIDVIPGPPSEVEFWDFATTFRRGEVDDMILTPISADGERGEAVTIAGDAIPFVCAVGDGRSPGLLLLAPLLWRRRRRSALAPR